MCCRNTLKLPLRDTLKLSLRDTLKVSLNNFQKLFFSVPEGHFQRAQDHWESKTQGSLQKKVLWQTARYGLGTVKFGKLHWRLASTDVGRDRAPSAHGSLPPPADARCWLSKSILRYNVAGLCVSLILTALFSWPLSFILFLVIMSERPKKHSFFMTGQTTLQFAKVAVVDRDNQAVPVPIDADPSPQVQGPAPATICKCG